MTLRTARDPQRREFETPTVTRVRDERSRKSSVNVETWTHRSRYGCGPTGGRVATKCTPVRTGTSKPHNEPKVLALVPLYVYCDGETPVPFL